MGIRRRCDPVHFNSRPHGGRRDGPWPVSAISSISTHALTEGDKYIIDAPAPYIVFQLTPSRRATDSSSRTEYCIHISTHALTEGDKARLRPW